MKLTDNKKLVLVIAVAVILFVAVVALASRALAAADRMETVSIWEKPNQHRIRVSRGSGEVNMVLILDNGDERCGITVPSQKARALGRDLGQAADDADATAEP